MADSAPKVAAPERQEPLDSVDKKAQLLADEIKMSKHFIVFTGAGVSTSAGIPDFRGPEGAWTLRAQGRERKGKQISTLQAIPTPTHMALVALQEKGYLKYLISQNCDGLHRRSGILPQNISELHGNSNREYCDKCGKEYMRDFRAVATYDKTVFDHRTGRKCQMPGCTGVLLDTIINFGEYLFDEPLSRARAEATKADLCIVLGSSLTVPPAAEVPRNLVEGLGRRKTKGKLVICNLQETPLDDIAEKKLRVWSKADELMIRIMEKLDLEIPNFILRRRLVVELDKSNEDRPVLKVSGIDVDGTPASFLKSVKLEYNRRTVRDEPFLFNFRNSLEEELVLKLELEFMGHYSEPNLVIEHDVAEEKAAWLLEYNPQNGEWKASKQDVEERQEQAPAAGPIPQIIDLTLDDTL